MVDKYLLTQLLDGAYTKAVSLQQFFESAKGDLTGVNDKLI